MVTDAKKRFGSTLPQITNLGIFVKNQKACEYMADVLKLFEDSITTLTIDSERPDPLDFDQSLDLLGSRGLVLRNTNFIRLRNLRHFSIGYLQMWEESLRTFLVSCKSLETLSVNCLDMQIPFSYLLLDFLADICGEKNEDDMNEEFELEANEDASVGAGDNVHLREATSRRTWNIQYKQVGYFSCRLAPIKPRPNSQATKTITHLEINFGLGSNYGIPFADAVTMFQRDKAYMWDMEVLKLRCPFGWCIETEAEMKVNQLFCP